MLRSDANDPINEGNYNPLYLLPHQAADANDPINEGNYNSFSRGIVCQKDANDPINEGNYNNLTAVCGALKMQMIPLMKGTTTGDDRSWV